MQRFRDFVDGLLRLPWSRFSITVGVGNGPGVPSSVQATIAQLRYWLPTIADVAHITEGASGEGWQFAIRPRTDGGCPVAVAVSETGQLDFTIAGETYEGRTLDTLDQLLPLVERITEGHVVQRRWTSRATGGFRGIETIVVLGPGRVWRDGMTAPEAGAESHDHHFLPYRRI